MVSVVIIGTGNMAQALFTGFRQNGNIDVKQVVGRSEEKLSYFAGDIPVCTDYAHLYKADVYVLAVADGAISKVAQELPPLQGLVVHTSGATSIDALRPKEHIGVFYPLQTFTHGLTPDFREIPICVEAQHIEDEALLVTLASHISQNVRKIASSERKILHLCAVFVNNFTNFMYQIGHEICDDHHLDSTLLYPLIQETAKKACLVSPFMAQTGPARRGDQKTMHAHLDLLDKEEHKQLYILMSNAIKKQYEKKL
jgi:predicted short-subunit dehydrogenase-like oxidoreductase (DUF2520 family)